MSSGSSLGSLASTGSHGSQSSVAASLSDIYLDPCQRLAYDLTEIDREALFQRVDCLLKHSGDLLPSSCPNYNHGMARTAPSQDSINSSSDVASGVGCLPTYEQHLERQKCRNRSPLPAAQVNPVSLTNSLQALPVGSFTSQLIASSSADFWPQPTEMSSSASDEQCDSQVQSSFSEVTASQIRYICIGQSDVCSGVSADVAGGSDSALLGEFNRSSSRHVSSGSAAESDSSICDASMQQ